MMKKLILSLSAVMAAVMLCGYIHPTSYLLEQAAIQWNNRPALAATGVITRFDPQDGLVRDTGSFRLDVSRDGAFKYRVELDGGAEATLYGPDGQRRTNPANIAASPRQVAMELFSRMGRSRELLSWLKSLGMESAKGAFDRSLGEVCYRFGNPDDAASPVLWLDKEGLWPVTLRLVREGRPVRLDFSRWRDPLCKTYLPRTIDISVDGRLVERISLERVDLFKAFDPAHFSKP